MVTTSRRQGGEGGEVAVKGLSWNPGLHKWHEVAPHGQHPSQHPLKWRQAAEEEAPASFENNRSGGGRGRGREGGHALAKH